MFTQKIYPGNNNEEIFVSVFENRIAASMIFIKCFIKFFNQFILKYSILNIIFIYEEGLLIYRKP